MGDSGTPKSFSKLNLAGLALGPAVGVVLVLVPDLDPAFPKANAMLSITMLTTIWWVTEVVPLPVASLLPFILLPFARILPGDQVANLYMNWVVFLFIGSFLVGKALEKTNLHKRIALKFLGVLGSSPRMLLFAFMSVAWLVSMFASNTATTAMLLPFANTVTEKHHEDGDEVNDAEGEDEDEESAVAPMTSMSPSEKEAAGPAAQAESEGDAVRARFAKGILIGIAYGATAGGVATIVGTAPNTVLVSQVGQIFGQTITFGQWFSFGFPVALAVLLLAWVVLTLFYVPRGDKVRLIKVDRRVFQAAGNRLGRMSQDERVVAVVECIMLLLWFLRPYVISPYVGACSDGLSTGEASCEAEGGTWEAYVTDGQIACGMSLLLFLVPAVTLPPQLDDNGAVQGARILSAKDVAELPWGLFLLFGSGFAISAGFLESGLSRVIGNALSGLTTLSPGGMVFLIALFVCFVTELASNTATSNIMIAILAPVAVEAGIHPYLLLVPSTIAASLAFMLPVATPPNAVVFSTGKIAFRDMIPPGFVLNWLGVSALTALFFTLGLAVFDIELGELPDWARVFESNSTSCRIVNGTAVLA